MHPIRIGTRGSQLALWQAKWVQKAIEERFPGIEVTLAIIKTQGDKILDVPLARVGGKGLFVKEIEEALLDGRIDLAVHSMKDMPAEIPAGLVIGAVPPREAPNDVLVAVGGRSLADLPAGGVVGTSSLRRSAQLSHLRPDLRVVPLRGNLDTRLAKLKAGGMDAIILAAAGLKRLGLEAHITEYLDITRFLPAVGQGALCIEARRDEPRIQPVLDALDHPPTRTVVAGERAFLHRLGGGCQVPIAGHGTLCDGGFSLCGLVADLEGRHMVKETLQGPAADVTRIGKTLAETLLAKGAGGILTRLTTG